MNKKKLFSLLFFIHLSCFVNGEETDFSTYIRDEKSVSSKRKPPVEKQLGPPKIAEQTPCNPIFKPFQVAVRHSQGSGVGYNHGYTTLEGFFSYRNCHHPWIPFIDLRGHMFNNAKYAANAGIGLRYAKSSVAWGINGYYDYRNTNEYHYNQVSAGLEAIGSFWSVHLNGYLPVGKKRSPFFDPSFVGTASGVPSFGFFQGNQLFLRLSGSQALTAKQEFAFKGLDAMASFRVFTKGIFSIDVGAGPYYFDGAYEKFAAGGKAYVKANLTDYVTLSLSGSYDNLFHQRGQGILGITIPFGPRGFGQKCSEAPPLQTIIIFRFIAGQRGRTE